MFFRKSVTVNNFIKSFSIMKNTTPCENNIFENIFIKKTEEKNVNFDKGENFLKGDPASIVFQNIISYMGGVKDIWKNSKGRIGLEKSDEIKGLILSEQYISDGKLECFTFNHSYSQAIERLIMKGNANKVYQGSGPIILKFDERSNDKYNRIYMNIDGEYLNLVKPSELIIMRNEVFREAKIQFLMK